MIEDIVRTFINDLKKTPEYKQAWKTIPYTKDIIFDFHDLKFYNRDEKGYNFKTQIVMDEELLLGE